MDGGLASLSPPYETEPMASPRHCERSEAIQSHRVCRKMDCFAALAMTGIWLCVLATCLPEACISFALINYEGAGKTGCVPHPRSRVRFAHRNAAHEHTGSAEASRPSLRNGFTAYLVLFPERTALLPPSPLRDFRLS